MDKYLKMFQDAGSDHPMQSEYADALRDIPQQQDYNPSKWRKLAAALIGGATGASAGPIAAIGAAERVGNAPYQNALEAYKRRVDATRAGAEMEHTNISDYRENLKSAATLSMADRNARTDRFKAESLHQYQIGELMNKYNEDVTARQNVRSEIDRRLAQTNNEVEQNNLLRAKNEIDAADKRSEAAHRTVLGAAATQNAGAAVASAGAAQTNAEANMLRARNTVPTPHLPDMKNVGEARDLAMEELSRDPKYSNLYKRNMAKDGPDWIVDPKWDNPNAQRDLEDKTNEILRRSYTNYGGPGGGRSSRPPNPSPFGNVQFFNR
jgi:gas vesicle protein